MSVANATVSRPWFAQAWGVVSDLLVATALIWALPLLLGVATALVRFLRNTM
jgi:hypothetical protein